MFLFLSQTHLTQHARSIQKSSEAGMEIWQGGSSAQHGIWCGGDVFVLTSLRTVAAYGKKCSPVPYYNFDWVHRSSRPFPSTLRCLLKHIYEYTCVVQLDVIYRLLRCNGFFGFFQLRKPCNEIIRSARADMTDFLQWASFWWDRSSSLPCVEGFCIQFLTIKTILAKLL